LKLNLKITLIRTRIKYPTRQYKYYSHLYKLNFRQRIEIIEGFTKI